MYERDISEEKWKKRKVYFKGQFVYPELKRDYSSPFEEYSMRLDGSLVGYIGQCEDGWFAPFFETYDEQGRLIKSVELYESKILITSIRRILTELEKDGKEEQYDSH